MTKELSSGRLAPLSWSERMRTRWEVFRAGSPARVWAIAVSNRNKDALRRYATMGIPSRSVDAHVLFDALEQSDARPLRWLLMSGANPNAKWSSNYNDQLLHRAVAQGRLDQVNTLIQWGADLEGRDGNDYTPLGTALVGFGESARGWAHRRLVLPALLEAGAKINTQVRRQRDTILSVAPVDPEIIQYLLENGGDIASMGGSLATSVDPLLFRAPELDSLEKLPRWLKLMSDYGQGPETTNSKGQRLPWAMIPGWVRLSRAPVEGIGELLRVLKESGHDLLGADAQGDTMLHVWAREASSFFCEWGEALFNEPGMNEQVLQKNHEGKTAAHLLGERADWLSKSPSAVPFLRKMEAFEKEERLESILPDTSASTIIPVRPRL